MKGQRGGKQAEGARRLVKSLTSSVTNWPGQAAEQGMNGISSTVCYTQRECAGRAGRLAQWGIKGAVATLQGDQAACSTETLHGQQALLK